MSAFFSTLSCCWFWLLLGLLLGWLLNRWLCKCCCKTKHPNSQATIEPAKQAPTKLTPAKVAPTKIADIPTTSKVKVAAPKAAVTSSAPTSVNIDVAAAKAAGFALKNANDLTVVEGIGPKINELFQGNDIKTFAQLGSATVPQMRAILDAGGSRFRIANPSTWAQQAALAADNKWVELKKLQDALSGGVKK